jgi:hypothetical protein
MRAGKVKPFVLACAFLSAAGVAAARPGEECPTELRLDAGDTQTGDSFGYAVAVQDDLVFVGAWGDDDLGTNTGAVYVFRRDGAEWTRVDKLYADDPADANAFGYSLALSGDLLVVGSPGCDPGAFDNGAAYIFWRTGDSWSQVAKVWAGDPTRQKYLGVTAAIHDDRVVMGAFGDDRLGLRTGAAYVFGPSGLEWVEEAKLFAGDGQAEDLFGVSVGVEGDVVVVGSFLHDGYGRNAGAVYVYRRVEGEWVEDDKFIALDTVSLDTFGRALSIDQGLLLVGADGDDDNGSSSGSGYVFRLEAGRWVQEAKLVAEDGEAEELLGSSAALRGDTAILGAIWDDENGVRSGSAYVFRRTVGAGGPTWQQSAKLVPDDGGPSAVFGASSATDGVRALVGSYLSSDYGNQSGAAYMFDLACLSTCSRDPAWVCDGDVDGDGTVNPMDYGLVQGAFCVEGDCDPNDLCQYDLDCNGAINPVDAGIVQSLFGVCEEPRDVCP